MYKAIASDLDGTILNNKVELTKETIDAINSFRNNGGIFAISTGRSYTSAKWVADSLGGDIPMILFNGSKVMFSESKKVIQDLALNDDSALKIINIILFFKGTFIYWQDEQLIVSEYNDLTKPYIKKNVNNYIIYNPNINKVSHLSKIIWIDNKENHTQNRTYLKDFNDINLFTSAPEYLEIVPNGVSKGTSIKILADFLHLSLDEIIGVGDGENDIELLKNCGVGVAPKNAPTKVQENANYVSKSTNDDCLIGEIINIYINK